MERTILKVEIEMKMKSEDDVATISNENGDVKLKLPASEVRKKTRGATRIYFYGKVENNKPLLDDIAPLQNW